MNSGITKVSVIIPAFNEADNIQRTIESVQKDRAIEIIVVDNGSTDTTVEKTEELGVRVIEMPIGTIAAVRNRGALEASGDILIFIDADVTVSTEWHRNLPSTVEELSRSNMMVTGSRVLPPKSNNLIHKYWYEELISYHANYINSGHLITTRSLFNKINGFTEELETAEDYDFCSKAREIGAEILNKKELTVTHEGYPTSLWGFVKRERWHGLQDVKTWPSFVESRVAWLAALNLVLFLIAIVVTINGVLAAIPVYLALMYVVSLLLSIYKFGIKGPNHILLTPIFFYFYLCGRSLSIVDRLIKFVF